ncbi:MAG: type III secretion system chaperone [Anaerolineae bacterium]|nr:type III secretion system chaperone [Anaerolineae bacterium]
MSLHEDINAGLALVSRSGASPLTLDASGWIGVPVPMPPAVIQLQNGQLVVEVQVAATGDFFKLTTPLAVCKSTPGAPFLEALLQRQFTSDHVSGASFALAATGDADVLVAVYHWMLDTITPEQFKSLFKRFVAAAFDLIDEVNAMVQREPKVKPIHLGRE